MTIFRDLDLNQKTEFEYELDYFCRGHGEISARPESDSFGNTGTSSKSYRSDGQARR